MRQVCIHILFDFRTIASEGRKPERALEVKSLKRNNFETTWRRELRFLLFEMRARAGGPSELYT